MTRVKVCGLTREEDVTVAVDAGADALGFIVDVPVDTPREISVRRAADLVEVVPPFSTSVLVTMPDDPDHVVELVERVRPDALQLHGELSAGDLAYLAAKLDVTLLKTVPADDIEAAHRYDDLVDALLVDSVDEQGAGGTGRTHDWAATRDLLAQVDSPVVLAGGLNPGNVADAVETVNPYAVDVASGVEETGGRKDHNSVIRFVERAKQDRKVPVDT